MFESLVETRRTVNVARKVASLPLAVGIHGIIVLAFFAYSIYAHEVLESPPVQVRFFSAPAPPPPVPVTRPQPKAPAQPKTAAQPKVPAIRPDELVTPREILNHIPPPGPETAAPEGPIIEGAMVIGRDGVDGPGDPILKESGIPMAKPIMHLGPRIRPPKLIHQIQPLYPQAAGAMGLSGKVVLELVINERGEVVEARVVRSDNSIFDDSALDAVRRWKFSAPITEEGQIVWVYHYVTVNFQSRR